PSVHAEERRGVHRRRIHREPPVGEGTAQARVLHHRVRVRRIRAGPRRTGPRGPEGRRFDAQGDIAARRREEAAGSAGDPAGSHPLVIALAGGETASCLPFREAGDSSPALSFMRPLIFVVCAALASGQSIDWNKTNEELLRYFQALVQIDTTDPPGNETK